MFSTHRYLDSELIYTHRTITIHCIEWGYRRKKTLLWSQSHRIAGWAWKGHMEVIWSNPSAQAGPPRAYSIWHYQFVIFTFIVYAKWQSTILYPMLFSISCMIFRKLTLSLANKKMWDDPDHFLPVLREKAVCRNLHFLLTSAACQPHRWLAS